MKIAILTEEFIPYPGGIARYVSKLAEECCLKGNEVDVIVIGNRQSINKDVINNYNVIHCYNKEYKLRDYFSIRKNLKNRLEMGKYDLVIAGDYRTMIVSAYIGRHINKKAIIHGSEVQSKLLKLLAFINIKPMLRFDKIIANSRNTQNLAYEYHPYLKSRKLVNVSYLGMNLPPTSYDCKYTTFPQDKITLLSVGRIEFRKGLHVTLEALSLDTTKSIDFYVVGKVIDEEYYKSLQEQVKILRRDINVIFTGVVDDDALESLYRKCDIFIHSSVSMKYSSEGFGLVVLEATSRNIPVIVSDTDALPEVVSNNVTGILVKNNSAEDLSCALNQMILEPPFDCLPNEASKAFLNTFSWSNHLEGIINA